MRELFARLRLHFEPTAFEKGLVLSFRGERHVAHADPVLLERMLRNLVSNAIRYTDDGGVLVSCRPARRQAAAAGVGHRHRHRRASLPRIFDEFYQAQSQRPLRGAPAQGPGPGPGHREAAGRPAGSADRVRSRVGHGTVFSLEVPVGKARARIERPRPGTAPLGLTLQGRLIVVVEDEPAVREGLVVLLKAWGASVLDFDSVEARSLAGAAARPSAPDLLLVDYRLPRATPGMDALAALRAHWPARNLPAIVITGSSLGGHESEAAEHDFHLLIKPVLPNKLRAMIAFKLGVR